MRFHEYMVKKRSKGSKLFDPDWTLRGLAYEAGLNERTLHRLKLGHAIAYRSAAALEPYLEGRVSIEEMCRGC